MSILAALSTAPAAAFSNSVSLRGGSAMQLARQPGFWHYAIELELFVSRRTRDILSIVSKCGLAFTLEVSMGRHGRATRLPPR